ncbi:MAG: DUF2993 domain-containing protein [Armatimonadetes bacterium]|nr:DUF2993 domain-containing protein [Armatimonadota bacterium]
MINRRLRWAPWILGCGLLLGTLACGAITAEQVKQRLASKITSKWKTQGLKIWVVPYSAESTNKGRFKKITVMASSVIVSGVKMSPVSISAEDVTLDLGKLLRENRVVTTKRRASHFSAKVSQSSLNVALAHKETPIQNLACTLGNGTLTFTGTYRMGFGANLKLEGVLECPDHYKLNFVPKRASVSGVPLPAGPLKTLLSRMNPLIDFRTVPLSPRVEKITISSGTLTISG